MYEGAWVSRSSVKINKKVCRRPAVCKASNTFTNKDGPDAGSLVDWGRFVVTQLVWRINTISLNWNETGQQKNLYLETIRDELCSVSGDRFRMTSSPAWVPFPTSLKPSQRGLVTSWLAARGTPQAASTHWLGVSLLSLHTGDLNPPQTNTNGTATMSTFDLPH